MSRYNDTITLLSPSERYQDAGGSWHEGERKETTVFCNRFSLGLSATSAALDMGLRATAQVQVRAVDYDGQDQCYYPARTSADEDMTGRELDVTHATQGGDFVVLTLGRKLGNQ